MRGAKVAVALALAVALAGCGDGSIEAAPVRVPTAPAELDPSGAYFAAGSLHLGEREQPIDGLRTFVVAARTVAYVNEAGRLCFTDLADRTCTDYEPYEDLRLSADGERLGFLDAAHGPKDRFDTRQLTATVLDLSSGDVLLSSTEGMGDPGDDDLADLYEDAEPSFRGFDAAGEAVVDGTDGDPDGQVVARDAPGRTVTVERDGDAVQVRDGAPNNSLDQGRLSPDEDYVLTGSEESEVGFRVAAVEDGRLSDLPAPTDAWWAFGTWSGPHQLLATTTDDAQSRLGIQRCDLATRICEQIDEIPIKTGDVDAVKFPSTTATDAETLGGM